MITLRPSDDRGFADHGWLKARHSFSFAGYHDPAHMGFRVLRVINEDVVAAGQGFGTHPHRDMEIFTWILDGALEHKDGMGNGSVIRPGDAQWMSAGTGITHSEFNPQPDASTHLLQIWILPDRKNREPDYAEKHFPREDRQEQLCLLASADGAEDSLTWGQDARLWASSLAAGSVLEQTLAPGRHAWLQVTSGTLTVNELTLDAGDGAAVSDETTLKLEASEDADFLLFDLP
jgi:redox-sensitive bicupin YhaK (pirin superfamily)